MQAKRLKFNNKLNLKLENSTSKLTQKLNKIKNCKKFLNLKEFIPLKKPKTNIPSIIINNCMSFTFSKSIKDANIISSTNSPNKIVDREHSKKGYINLDFKNNIKKPKKNFLFQNYMTNGKKNRQLYLRFLNDTNYNYKKKYNHNLKTNNFDTKDYTYHLLKHNLKNEEYRRKNFNNEFKYIITQAKSEIMKENNKLFFSYSQKNHPIKPSFLSRKNSLSKITNLNLDSNDENLYKFNIMARSKIINIKDIQKSRSKTFFNTEKNEKKNLAKSLKNLNLLIKRKAKYISDNYKNSEIEKPQIQIHKYKSEKLHEIYEAINEMK